MRYVNTRTRAIIETECEIAGKEWVAESPEVTKEKSKKKGKEEE